MHDLIYSFIESSFRLPDAWADCPACRSGKLLGTPAGSSHSAFFSGPTWLGELKGVGLDELVLSGDMAGPEQEPHYTLPISTISPTFSDSPATPTVELPPNFDMPPMATSKEKVSPSLRPNSSPGLH